MEGEKPLKLYVWTELGLLIVDWNYQLRISYDIIELLISTIRYDTLEVYCWTELYATLFDGQLIIVINLGQHRQSSSDHYIGMLAT